MTEINEISISHRLDFLEDENPILRNCEETGANGDVKGEDREKIFKLRKLRF